MSSANDIPQRAQDSSDPLDMFENNTKPILTYGSLIYLTFTEENHSEYYAYSEGLTKTKVLLKTKESFNREGAYTRGLFRIYPSFYHNEYIKAKAKFQDIMSGDTATQLDKRETRTQVPKLVKGLSEELALNLDIYEKFTGTPVRYGQVIQLLHVGSQKYLSYDPEAPSDLESDCLKIELKYENSDYTCFRILPSFKYQQESQGYIYNEDIVYMMSIVDSGGRIFGDPYLHASRTIGALNKDNPNKENLDKKEINVSSDKKTQWKLKIFSDFISDKVGVLSIGDIIWINLSEEDKNLIVFNSNERENEYSFKFVLCSSSDRYKKFVGNSNGMFMIEGPNMAQGGLVKWKTPYRLKHLTTNKYLSVGPQQPWEIDERKDNRIHSFKLVSSDKEAANFYFEILYSTISSQNKQFFTKYVPKDAYFKLRVENDLWVTYRDMYKGALEVKDQYDDDYVTLPLIGKTKENNIFHCSRATQNEVIVTMFLISCKNTIRNTLKYLDPEFMSYSESDFQQLQLKHKVVTYKLERMKACLKQLELFCENKLFDYLSVDQIYGQTNPFIQNILKEQFFIELLAYTLVICFPQHQHLEDLKKTEAARKDRQEKKDQNNSVNLLAPSPIAMSPTDKIFFKKMSSAVPVKEHFDDAFDINAFTSEIIEDINHKKKRICELSYKLIMAVVDKNIPNKLHAFQYLAVFQMQAEYMPYAVDTVNLILRDNEELLLNLHKNNMTFQGTQAPGFGPQHQLSIFNARADIKMKHSVLSKIQARDSFRGVKGGSSSNLVSQTSGIKEDVYERAYVNYYNKMAKNFQVSLLKILKDWDPIKFFAVLLQRTENVHRQKKLLHFFKTISLHGQEGININQEIIYKYFTYVNSTGHTIVDLNLLRLFSKEGNKLFVKVPFGKFKGKEYELKEFLDTNDGADDSTLLQNDNDDDDSSVEERDPHYFENLERRNEDVLINHIDLCAALCRSRNYSWKHSLEREISWESLMGHFLEELPPDIKAALSRLMTSLYIDQEPRREMAIPLFCKVVDRRKLAKLESGKQNGMLETVTTMKTKDFKESTTDVNIQKFKDQLLKEIEQLDKTVEQLPLELSKENLMVFEAQIKAHWPKAYNSYILELINTVHLMLKFNKIRIDAKKIAIQPLKNEVVEKGRRKGKSKTNFNLGISLNLNLNLNLNLFNRSKPKEELTEFENILRSLMLLLEYDKTYPEAKKMLNEMRKEKKEKKDQDKNVLSAKKLFNTVQGLGSLAKGLLIDTKNNEKKANKKTIDLDFLDKELTTNELYLKQGDVMKRILQNLLSQQELDIEATIKIKILDILEYFFEYKQDKLLSNVRRVFYIMVKEGDLVKTFRENPEAVNARLQEVLPHYMKYILPRIQLTGTATDEQDAIFKADIGEDIMDINEMLGFELLPALFQQLCLNSHALFERKILHLMMRMYNQREEFSESIKHLLLLFEESNIEYYNRAKKVFQTLQKYSEESEKWLTSPELDEKALEETRHTLLFFYNSLFTQIPVNEEEDAHFDIQLIDHQPINKVRQDMYRHLKIYLPVLSLIKDNINIVERNKSEKILELFRICFAFLTAFVKNNETNQLLLSNHIVVFLYNLSLNLGHVKLLVELFRNNLMLCTTRVEEVIDDLCRLISINGRRAEYLEFFKVIQCNGDDMLFPNQRMVLDIFLLPQNKYSLLYLEPGKEGAREENKRSLKEIKSEKHGEFNNVFSFTAQSSNNKIDEPFLYHAQLFELLGLTASGKEGLILNEVRLRTMLDCEYLLSLLTKEDAFTSDNPDDNLINHLSAKGYEVIKIPVTRYIFFVYLESEKTAIDVSKNQAVMKNLLNKEEKRINAFKHYKDTYVTYLFDQLLPIFCWHYKQVRQGQIEGEEENPDIKRDFNELSQFTEMLVNNIGKFELTKISQEGRKNLLELLFFQEKTQKYAEMDALLKPKATVGEVLTSAADVKRETTEEEVWKSLWENFLDVFTESQALTEEIDKEKKIFAKALTQIDKMFKKDPHVKDIINNEEVVKKFINFVINSGNAEETRTTVILILEALGNLIQNEEEEEQTIEKQNFLNRNNAVYMIFSKLSDPNLLSSDRIFRELITFAIKLLEGGNEEVQKNVFKHFTSFSNSEVFFVKLHERFLQEILTMKKIRDSPGHKTEEDEIEEMKDVLRLLQLFAEGHFTDLQNYIRYQTNSYHSYDLLADISDLLNAYMQTKHTAFFDTMIQCFDTITEFIQGPCFENQVAIIQGSFLDLASSLLSVDELQEELLIKSGKKALVESDLKKWQWARLKYKCSITLMSLLEARKDESQVYRLMKSLPREVLRKNITDIYMMFNKQYKGDYNNKVFLHFNSDPDPEEGVTEEYCSLIIETGFNLYFLLNIFSEAKLPGENEEDGEIKDEEEEEKNVLTDNILTKWFGLIISLFKTSVSTAKNITKQTMEHTKKMTEMLKLANKTEENKTEGEDNAITLQLIEERATAWPEASKFFKKNTANIEVLREDNNLEKTYFYKLPFCHAITKDTKILFNSEVNRISAKAKCAFLLKNSPELIETIKHEYRLQTIFSRVALVALLVQNIMLWRDTAFLLAITINGLVLGTYQRNSDEDGYHSDSSRAVTVLGAILLVLSSVIVLYFLLKTAPLLIQKAWKGTKKDNVTLMTIVMNLFKTALYLITDPYVLYYCLYGFSAIIGLTITPFFFALHLLDVLMRFPLLQNVLKSIWIPRKSLLLTFLLFQMLNYFFSLIGYFALDADYEGACPSTWICFLTAVDKAFKVDGGLGGFLAANTDMNFPRFLFDNFYNLLIMIIMINIVAGIIIDNFGTLREEEKKFRYDLQNICFICGNDRETLEKASEAKGMAGGNGFSNHIKKDHYLWNYLFYIAYIQNKERTEYTGLESYIANQIDNGEISWFPTHKALILKGFGNSEDSNDVVESLKKVEQEQLGLMKDATQLSKNIFNLEDLVKKYELRKINGFSKHGTFKSVSSSIGLGDQNMPLLKVDMSSESKKRVSSIRYEDGMIGGGDTFDLNNDDHMA